MNPKSACGLASIMFSLLCVAAFLIGALFGLPAKVLYSIAIVLVVFALLFLMLGVAYDDIFGRSHMSRHRRRGLIA